MKAAFLSLMLFLLPSQLAAQGKPSLLSPANGATGVPVNPVLVWNKALEAHAFTLQLSSDPEFSSFIVNLGGLENDSMQVMGLEYNTTYYWRVGLEHGAALGLSVVRSFTTIVAAPIAPLLALPVDGATDVSTSPTLMWESVSEAESYHVQVSTDVGFSNLVVDQDGVTDTELEVPELSVGTLYYWRVSAANAGGVSVFSDGKNFTTIIAAPLAPLLALPADGATDVSVEAELSWNTSLAVDSYRLQVATDQDFDSLVYDQSELVDSLLAIAGLANNTTYYWRVSATNIGGTSLYSAVRSFTTIIAAPFAPLLASPADGAIDVPIDAELSWNISFTADSYRLQVATDSEFSSVVFDLGGLTDTSFVVDSLMYGTLYYWRIRAINVGGASLYSEVYSFTTAMLSLPIGPELVLPVDGATDVPLNLTFSWDSVIYAETYFIEVSTDTNFAELVVSQQNITEREVQIADLQHGTLYHWRVGFNVEGSMGIATIYSVKRSFTTVAAPTSVERLNNGIPKTFALQQNFPNPFNPMTTIQFSVAKESRVTLTVFNMLGAVVEVLADRTFTPGNYQVQWIPENLPSGVYFYRIHTADFTHTRKLLLLR